MTDALFQKNKAFLRQYLSIKRHINRLEEKLFELDSKSELQAQKISGMPASTVKKNFDDVLDKKSETEKRIDDLVKKSRKVKLKIYHALDELNSIDESRVLELFFIDDKSFAEIAQETNYTQRWVESLYADGIRHIKC